MLQLCLRVRVLALPEPHGDWMGKPTRSVNRAVSKECLQSEPKTSDEGRYTRRKQRSAAAETGSLDGCTEVWAMVQSPSVACVVTGSTQQAQPAQARAWHMRARLALDPPACACPWLVLCFPAAPTSFTPAVSPAAAHLCSTSAACCSPATRTSWSCSTDIVEKHKARNSLGTLPPAHVQT
jgi:hypothetical protein